MQSNDNARCYEEQKMDKNVNNVNKENVNYKNKNKNKSRKRNIFSEHSENAFVDEHETVRKMKIKKMQQEGYFIADSDGHIHHVPYGSDSSVPSTPKTSPTSSQSSYRVNTEADQRTYREMRKKFSNSIVSDVDFNYYFKWIEDICVFFSMILGDDTFSGRLKALTVFVKLRFGDSPLITIEGIDGLLALADSMFGDLVETQSDVPKFDMFEGSVSAIRNVLSNYTSLKEKPIFQKSHKVIGYLMSLAICKETNTPFNPELFKLLANEYTQKQWGEDFIVSIIDLLLFVTERGIQCYKTSSVEPILHSGTQYEEWYLRAKKHITMSEYLNNPEAHGVFIPKYQAELELLILQGECLRKYIDKIDKRSIIHVLGQLETIKHNQVGYDAALADRPAPKGMIINGGTNIAKSSFVHAVYVFYGRLFNLPVDPKYKYTRNAVDKHWNNFRSYKWCLVCDDCAFMHESRAGEGDPSVMEILQILNNIAFIPAQASLEDKGRTPCRFRLALFTTNTPHLNVKHYFSCPLAVLRRFPIIVDLEPKDEYRKDGSEWQFIDGAKLPVVAEGEFPDFWKIRIYKPVPERVNNVSPAPATFGNSGDYRLHQNASFELVEEFDSIYEFLSWFGVQAKQHEEVQEKYMNFTQNVSVNTLCESCYSSTTHCVCCKECGNNKYSSKCVHYERVRMQADTDDRMHSQAMVLYDDKIVDEHIDIICDEHIQEIPEPFIEFNIFQFYWLFISYILSMISHYVLEIILIYYKLNPQLIQNSILEKPLALYLTAHTDNTKRSLGFSMLASIARRKLGFSATMERRIAALGIFLMAFGASYALYRTCKWICSPTVTEHSVKIEELCKKPLPHKNERPEAWPRKAFTLSTNELSPMATSWKRFTKDEIIKMLVPNMKRYKTYADRNETEYNTTKSVMFGICGHIYVCNTHSIPEPPFTMEVWDDIDVSISLNKTIEITSKQVQRLSDDITLLLLYNFPPIKNIMGLIPKCILPEVFNGFYIVLEPDCTVSVVDVKAIKYKQLQKYMVYQGYPNVPMKVGDCGAMLITMSELGPILVGYHYLGGTTSHMYGSYNISGAQPLEYDQVQKAISLFNPITIDKTHIELSKPNYIVEQAEVHHKSPVNFLPAGVAKVITGHSIPRPRFVTNIVQNKLQRVLKRDNWTCKFVPPSKMNSWEPWYLGLEARTKTNKYFDYDTVQKAAQSLYSDIMKELPHEALSDIHMYDLDTALNGDPGIAHVNSIDWSTSMGFPYRKNKKHFRTPIEESDRFELTDEIRYEVEKILNLYSDSKLCHPIFSASLKDEVISKSKDEIGKIRIFMGAHGPWVLVVRMVFLWSSRIMQNYPYVFETAAGMQCHSDEWHVVYEYLTKFGTNKIVAGDYAGYDTNDDTLSIVFAFKVLIWIAKAANVPQEMLNMMECILEDTTYNVVEYWGVIIQLIGCLPSGFPLTLLINCIKNSIYMRCAYMKLSPERNCDQFKEHVSLMTMGDDNICGISDDAPWFNHTSISDVFASVGIVYTMDDKEAVSIPYINISEASFVKRKWVFNADLQVYVCPIAEESIKKSLFWRMKSKYVAPEKHACIVIGDALREYSYYGREIFCEKLEYFKSVVSELGYEMYLDDTTFATYEEHLNRWVLHSKYVNYDRKWSKLTPRGDQEFSQLNNNMSNINIDSYEEKMVGPIENKQEIIIVTQSDENIETKDGVAIPTPDAHVEGEQDGLIEFFDQYKGVHTTIPTSMRIVDKTDNASQMANWFSRPLLIDTYTWNIADPIATTHSINPWYAFFSNALNKYKLNNMAYVRCNLKIKVVVNSTPFLYGTYLLSYAPLQEQTVGPQTGFGNGILIGAAQQQFVLLSQMPHLWLDPHDAKGGEMTLPFIYNINWLTLAANTTEFQDMGTLNYSLVVPLQSANGATSSGVTVNTFCWAEDIEFSGATTTLAFQSSRGIEKKKKKDEYGEMGQISGPASAVAALAGWFTGAPFIGPFMTATQMGAKAVAAGAVALGYTNVPVISDVHGLRSMVNSGFANSEIGFQIEKLTLDPKNELTLDNTCLGINNRDELDIGYLVSKESYLGQFTWSQTAVEAAGLFSSAINPGSLVAYDTTTYSPKAKVYFPTPIAHFSQMFQYWRGDIILRFKVIASQYHKGRLRIAWDPTGDSSGNVITSDLTNAVYSEVFDIGAEKDIEVRIPYMQPLEWSNVIPFQTTTTYNNFGGLGSFAHVNNTTNGTLTVRVMNELSAPSTTATATILVFARAADNFELAGPASQWELNSQLLTLFGPQSDDGVELKAVVLGKSSVPRPERYLTNHGEGVRSLRQLLRRTTKVGVDIITLTDAKMNSFLKTQTRFPPCYGFDPSGLYQADKQIGTGTANFNFTTLHPSTWVQSCFLGVRGSMNWYFDTIHDSAQGTFSNADFFVSRRPCAPGTAASIYTSTAPGSSLSNWAWWFSGLNNVSSAGVAVTDTRVQPVNAVVAPNYSRYMFQGTNIYAANNPTYNDDGVKDMLQIGFTADEVAQSTGNFITRLYSYCGIGTDYNPVVFLHCPTVYELVNSPTPA